MKKSKLFLSIVSLCFSLAVLCFGIYAATSVSYQISGSLSYTASDVFIELKSGIYRCDSNCLDTQSCGMYFCDAIMNGAVDLPTAGASGDTYYFYPDDMWYPIEGDDIEDIEDGEYDGCPVADATFGIVSAESTKIKTYDASTGVFDASATSASLTQNITFGSGENQGFAYFITFEVTNYTREPVNLTIDPTLSNSTNIYASMTSSKSWTVEASNGTPVVARYVYCFCIKDVTQGASATYELDVAVSRLPKVTTSSGYTLYRYADGYYRMKMGSYDDKDIYWRLLRYNNANATSNMADLTSSSNGTAIFIQETYAMTKKFLDSNKYTYANNQYYLNAGSYNGISVSENSIYANDYLTSDIRGYLMSTSSGGFADDIGIIDEDIYENIISVSASDLYSESTLLDQTGHLASGNIPNQSDKFWLLSATEASGNTDGTWNNNNSSWFNKHVGEIDSDYYGWRDRRFEDEDGLIYSAVDDCDGSFYWLRSPYAYGSDYAYGVYNGGYIYGNIVVNVDPVRAAFKLAL